MPHTYGQALNDDLAGLILASPYNLFTRKYTLFNEIMQILFPETEFSGLFFT